MGEFNEEDEALKVMLGAAIEFIETVDGVISSDNADCHDEEVFRSMTDYMAGELSALVLRKRGEQGGYAQIKAFMRELSQ